MVFFAIQKLFSLMQSHLLIFAFVVFASDVKFKMLLPRPTSEFILFSLDFYDFISYIKDFNSFKVDFC